MPRHYAAKKGKTALKKKALAHKSGPKSLPAPSINNNWGRFLLKDPVPQRTFRRCTFSRIGGLVAGAAGIFGAAWDFRLNSPYDPEVGAGVVQADGFASMASIYSYYKVYAVDIEIEYFDVSADALTFAAMLTNPAETAVTPTGQTAIVIGSLSNVQTVRMANTGDQKGLTRYHLEMRDIMGFTKGEFDTDINNTVGTTVTNPGLSPQLHIAIAGIVGAETGSFFLKLTYNTVFFGRKVVTV